MAEHLPDAVAYWGELLEALDAYRQTRLFVKDDGDGWLLYVGSEPSRIDSGPAADGPAPAILTGLPEGDLSLFPLVVRTFEGYRPHVANGRADTLLVFDGLAHDELVYVGQFGRGHGKAWFEHYREIVQEKCLLAPLPYDEAGTEDLLHRARGAFETQYNIAIDARQIHPDVDLLGSNAECAIDDFIDSECQTALLVGDAGVGKSTHLYAAGKRAMGRGLTLLRTACEPVAPTTHAFGRALPRWHRRRNARQAAPVGSEARDLYRDYRPTNWRRMLSRTFVWGTSKERVSDLASFSYAPPKSPKSMFTIAGWRMYT